MSKEPFDTLINGGSGTQEVISSMSGSQTVIGIEEKVLIGDD